MEKIFSRVLIKDESNNVLVVQDREDIWNFPGGKLELGETPMECAQREVQEEIGLQIHQLTEISHSKFLFGDTQWMGYFYFADSVRGIPAMNELDKIKGMRFISNFDVVKFPEELSEINNLLSKNSLLQAKTTIWR